MSRLRVGVIGAGFVGRAHLDAIRRSAGVELVAVAAGSNVDAVRRDAEAFGIPRVYADYHELVDDPRIDVVHNCTPNHLHFAVNRAILEAGKACFSEKPLTTTSAEAVELVQLARRVGVPAGVNFNHRAFPQVQEARALVASGALGAVHAVHGNYLQDWLLLESDWNWRLDPRLGGASRTVADIGSHWMDLAQHVAGVRIVEVLADLSTILPTRLAPVGRVQTFQRADSQISAGQRVAMQTEDMASVLLRFDTGARGSYMVSQVSPGHKNRLTLEVDGAKSAVAWDSEDAERLWLGSRNEPNRVLLRDPGSARVAGISTLPAGHTEGWYEALKTSVEGFYARVRGECPPWSATFEDGLYEAILTEAILDSSRTRQWVSIMDHPALAALAERSYR